MSKQIGEERNDVDEEPEEGEIQDDEGSLEDVSSDEEVPTIAKRLKSDLYARSVRLPHGQFAKTRRQQLSCTPRREMRLCSSEKSDSAIKKRQGMPRSFSRATVVHDSYFDGHRYKSKELVQKVSGKVHEKENTEKDIKRARRRSASFHASGGEQRSTHITSEHGESYFSSTSSKGFWHKCDVKEKHKKRKKNSKSNKTNNPLVEVYESQLKSVNDSSSVDTCIKSSVKTGVELIVHQKEIDVEKNKPVLLSPPVFSEIEILEVPVIKPEVITIFDSDEEVLKKEKVENPDISMTAVEEKDKGNKMVQISAVSNASKGSIENDDDHEDNLILLREAALNSSKPEKSLNVNHDDEVLQLRLEALRSAVIRKYEERKKRGITLTKLSKIAGEKHLMSISPLGSPNPCSSGDSSLQIGDEVDPDMSSVEINNISNYHDSDQAIDNEVDKISTIDMELAESDEEKEHVRDESGDVHTYRAIATNVESDNSNCSKVNIDPAQRESYDFDILRCSTDEPITSALSQIDYSPSSVPAESSEVPLGYIIGDHELELDVVQEIQVSLSPPVQILLDSQSEVDNESKRCGDGVEVVENVEIYVPGQRHPDIVNNEHFPDEKQNYVQSHSISEETISTPFQPLEFCKTLDMESVKATDCEIFDAVSGRSDCSYVSTASGELDLESMIVLDEVGGCTDDAESVNSGEDVSGSVEVVNNHYADIQNNSENCDSEENTKPTEESSRNNFSGLLHTSRSSNDIVQSNSDGCEDYNVEMFGHVFANKYASNSRIVSENKNLDASNLSVHERNLQISEGGCLVESNVISSSNNDSGDLSLHECAHLSPLDSQCEKIDVSCSNSQCGTDVRIGDSDSQTSVNTNVCAIPPQGSKLSSEDNEQSLVNCHNVERNVSSNTQQNACLCSTCVDTTTSPVRCRNVVSKTDQTENHNDLRGVLPQEEHIQSDANVFSTESVDNICSNHDNSTEDEETVLRVRLLAMLKRANDLSIKEKPETDSSLKSGVSDHVRELPSQVILKVKSSVPHPNSCVTDIVSHVSSRNSEKSTNIMPRQLPLSQSSTNVQQTSSIPSVSKTIMYSSRNSPTMSRRGAKTSKHRIRNSKTHGRFNVNVPKFVINLGEDSDSGDDKSESLEHVSVSNFNGSDVSQESRDNPAGSQSVPPDFEKKLDMLLKQARFQQESSTKEDKKSSSDCTNESVSVSCSSKMVAVSSNRIDANVGKSISVNSGSSVTNILSNTKVSSVFEDSGSQEGRGTSKSQTNRTKILCYDNRVDLSRFSPCKRAEAKKQDIQLRTKNTSASRASPSVPSVVDIGLLPSCKQKEYIRLKKQLAQLARKETGVKTKENITLVNTSRLLVKKNGIEEGKLLANPAVRNTVIKDNIIVNTQRSPFTRKFVRRGQGGTVTLRNEIGKSRRIVRTVSNSYNSQSHLRNRLTVTAPNRIANVSTEGTSVVRRVLCVPQKRIITAAPGAKKVSSDIQITSNINVSADDKQRKLLVDNRSLESASLREKLHLQRKSAKIKDDENEGQVGNSVSSTSDVQKLGIGKTVISYKKKESVLEHSEVSVQSTFVIQKDSSNNQTTSEAQFQTTNVDSKNSGEKDVTESRSKLIDITQEQTTAKNAPCKRSNVKRKKSNSERNDVLLQRKRVVMDGASKEETVCSDDSNVKNADCVDIVDKTVAESLWTSECKLISKRYQVLEDIATVQMNLHEIQVVNEKKEVTMRNIQRLKEQLGLAEAQLNKEEELLTALYSEVENAKRDIMRKQSETLLLSVECEEMGGRVHGSSYNVPNSCTDLIRTGMGTVSKTLEHLKTERTSVREMSTLCSSGVPLSITTNTIQLDNGATVEDCNEDSSKLTPGSYSSPLEAIRKETESTSDNNAVLCPYHIMGSCKDKECSYLH